MMIKLRMSLWALISLIPFLSTPSLSMDQEKEGGDDRKNLSSPPLVPPATLEGIPSEVRYIIHSFVFQGDPRKWIIDAVSMQRTSKLLCEDVNTDVKERADKLRRSTKYTHLENWGHSTPLRDFVEVYFIHQAVYRNVGKSPCRDTADFQEESNEYLHDLRKGSLVSESRIIAYLLAMSRARHYGGDIYNRNHGKISDKNSRAFAREKILAAFDSFCQDLKDDKVQGRPFDHLKYKAILRFLTS